MRNKIKIVQISRVLKNNPATSIHPGKWKNLFSRYSNVEDSLLHPDNDFNVEADIVIIHGANSRPKIIDKAREAWPNSVIVAVLWNHLWLFDDPNFVRESLLKCDLCYGVNPPGVSCDLESWRELGHMLDEDIFFVQDTPRDFDIVAARVWSGRSIYWTDEVLKALEVYPDDKVFSLTGKQSPEEVASIFNRAKLVLCFREDGGPSYSVLEAALCGAIPVVSDCPALREHFETGGALFASRDVVSIREAINKGLAMSEEERLTWINRNSDYFRFWTLPFQGTKFMYEIFEKLKEKVK